MKKLIIFTLIATLVLALCACGAEKIIEINPTEGEVDTAAIRENFDKVNAFIESQIDTEALGMTASIQDDDNGQYLYTNWSSEEVVYDEIDMDVELDDNTVTIGKTTVAELKEMGFQIDSETETVSAETGYGFSIRKGDKICNVSVDNNTDTEQNIYDLTVTEINSLNPEYSIDLTYNGLKLGDSFKDVLDKIGAPHSNIHISADSINTTIELGYFSDKIEGNFNINENLNIYMVYDAEANNATVSSISISQNSYPLEQDGAAE